MALAISGRFNRNTLQYILDIVWHPLRPRTVHRLDANTTGVMVLCKTQHFARLVQPQFERGEVEKVYLARVQGHPQQDEFTCDAPVSAEAGKLGKPQPEYWAMQAFEHHKLEGGHCDRGVFSIFFFNLVKVLPGEGIYQGAGIPHAYLDGVNVELMANSDNVFRGGLTVKHVDVPELLAHLVFDPVEPRILRGEPVSEAEWAYRTPAPDFQLNRIQLSKGQLYHPPAPDGPEIVLVIEGKVSFAGNGQTYSKGKAFFVPAGSDYSLLGEEESLLFKAMVP